MVWCGVVWCGVVWCGVVWCGVVWCGVVWCGVVWCVFILSLNLNANILTKEPLLVTPTTTDGHIAINKVFLEIRQANRFTCTWNRIHAQEGRIKQRSHLYKINHLSTIIRLSDS